MRKFVLLLIILCTILITSTAVSGVCDLINKNKYLFFDDFESGAINTSLWGVFSAHPTYYPTWPLCIINASAKHTGSWGMGCQFKSGAWSQIEDKKQFGRDVMIYFEVSIVDNTIANSVDMYLSGTISPLGRWNNISAVWEYHDTVDRTFGVAANSYNQWHSMTIVPYGGIGSGFNLTINGSMKKNISPGGVPFSGKFNITFATDKTPLWIDNVMAWNTTIYGNICPQVTPPAKQSAWKNFTKQNGSIQNVTSFKTYVNVTDFATKANYTITNSTTRFLINMSAPDCNATPIVFPCKRKNVATSTFSMINISTYGSYGLTINSTDGALSGYTASLSKRLRFRLQSPVIGISKINCTSCNPPYGDNSTPYSSTTTTPTFTFLTDRASRCRVSKVSYSYRSMNNTRNCTSGEWGVAHTCTLIAMDWLMPPAANMYITCTNFVQNTTIQELAIDLSALGGGGGNVTGTAWQYAQITNYTNTKVTINLTVGLYNPNTAKNFTSVTVTPNAAWFGSAKTTYVDKNTTRLVTFKNISIRTMNDRFITIPATAITGDIVMSTNTIQLMVGIDPPSIWKKTGIVNCSAGQNCKEATAIPYNLTYVDSGRFDIYAPLQVDERHNTQEQCLTYIWHEETAPYTYAWNWTAGVTTPLNSQDGSWSTLSKGGNAAIPDHIYFNYSIPQGILYANYTAKAGCYNVGGSLSNGVDYWNYATNDFATLGSYGLANNVTRTIPADGISGSLLRIAVHVYANKEAGAGCLARPFYEGKVLFYRNGKLVTN